MTRKQWLKSGTALIRTGIPIRQLPPTSVWASEAQRRRIMGKTDGEAERQSA